MRFAWYTSVLPGVPSGNGTSWYTSVLPGVPQRRPARSRRGRSGGGRGLGDIADFGAVLEPVLVQWTTPKNVFGILCRRFKGVPIMVLGWGEEWVVWAGVAVSYGLGYATLVASSGYSTV